jgi:hypothetical protein
LHRRDARLDGVVEVGPVEIVREADDRIGEQASGAVDDDDGRNGADAVGLCQCLRRSDVAAEAAQALVRIDVDLADDDAQPLRGSVCHRTDVSRARPRAIGAVGLCEEQQQRRTPCPGGGGIGGEVARVRHGTRVGKRGKTAC